LRRNKSSSAILNGLQSNPLPTLRCFTAFPPIKSFAFSKRQKTPDPSRIVPLADYVQATVGFKLHDWQKEHLCPILERCLTEKGLRIAIHKPPQYGGSIIVSQRLPGWLIGNDPTHRFGLACYNETRARDHGETAKQILQTDEYRRMFPYIQVRSDAAAGKWSTEQRIELMDGQSSFSAFGLLSGFTGKGVDTLVIDDPYKSDDEAKSETINEKVWRFWERTAGVRISDESNVIVMFHRYHKDDFAARVIAAGFEYVRFPAIADANEDGADPTGRSVGELLSPMRSQEWLDRQLEQSEETFYGQFQGLPRAPGKEIFREEYFEIIKELPNLKPWIRGWDLATSVKETGDYTVGTMLGIGDDGEIYIADVNRFRLEWPDAYDEITAQAVQDKCPMAVDRTASQLGFVQHLARSKDIEWIEEIEKFLVVAQHQEVKKRRPMFGANLRGDKKIRASHLAQTAKRHGIKLLKGDWNDAFLKEFTDFDGLEMGHDDQVDSAVIAYDIAKKLPYGTNKAKTEILPGSPAYYAQLKARRKRSESSA
jgi:predicted phage terminase large subunit-like protein